MVSYNKNDFTAEEQKNINLGSYTISIFVILANLFLALNNIIEKVGGHILYAFGGLAAASLAVAAVFIVLFFARLRKIQPFRGRYCICVVIAALMSAAVIYIGAPYVIDIFSKTETVTTSEYTVSGKNKAYVSFIDSSGQQIGVQLTKENAAELDKVGLSKSQPWSENGLMYHESSVTIEYYPNSRVLSSVYVN